MLLCPSSPRPAPSPAATPSEGRNRIREDAARDLARVERFSVHQFDRFGVASLVTRTTNDTTQVQQMPIMMLGMGSRR
jgi:ABC-type multidrug transport system fused ATPase/permease subunit